MRTTVVRLALALSLVATSIVVAAADRTYGLNFSPYMNGQDPNRGAQVTAAQILQRLQIIAPYTTWVRSFGMTHGLEQIPQLARQLGLKVAAGAWISRDAAQNALEVSNLIAAANAGLVDIAIVGSEAILRNDVSEAQLIAYMNQVRQAIPASVPVTTADVYGVLLAHPNLIAASDLVFGNFYPYWEGTSISNAMCAVQQRYQQVVVAAGGKRVWVSEAGWPSAGDRVGAAVPSAANANAFARRFFTWAEANGIESLYFAAFDEEFKTMYEGAVGAHWGIWDANGAIKPGMDAFFNGEREAVDCNAVIPGPVGLAPVYVPPYGSSDILEVQVTGVRPGDYKVATYIFVGGWWTKPTFAEPTVAINPDGTARIPIVTGGSDQLATQIAAFLIPTGVVPPQANGGALPNVPGAIATFQVTRSANSISGTIIDRVGAPIAGVVVADPSLGHAVTASDGKYSFYSIGNAASAVLTVSHPNYVFPTSPATLNSVIGNQQANFVGIGIVDLIATSAVSPNPVVIGGNVTQTIVVSNSGPAATEDANVSVTLPNSFQVISVGSSRGTCTVGPPISCQIGALSRSAIATITLVAHPANTGQFSLSATVSGSDPDSNGTNNATTATVTVESPAPITVTAVSVTPANGSGTTQTFGLQYSSTSGAAAISTVWAWFNATSNTAANSCFVQYDRSNNGVLLLNDAGTGYVGGVLGENSMLQNSQCAITLANSSIVLAGNTLTLSLAMTFKPAFAGTKNIYMFAAAGGVMSGWQDRGDWIVPAGAPIPVVTADLASPSSGTGTTQTFGLHYSSNTGAASITTVWGWFTATSNTAANSCFVQYDRSNNGVLLLNDAGTGYVGGVLGENSTLQNSQCAIALANSSRVLAGNTLTLSLAMTFKVAFAGAKDIYLYAAAGDIGSGWQDRGDWIVPAGPPIPVVTTAPVSPGSGTGTTQTFALPYSSTAGAASITTVWGWFTATSNTAANSCFVQYDRSNNGVLLLNDAGTGWVGGALGENSTLQNSQCAIALANSSTALAGNTLTLSLAMTFKAAFAGAKEIYLYAAAGDIGSGWQDRGDWIVPAGPPIPVVTTAPVSPQSGTGTTQTFALPYLSTAGAASITTVWGWFTATSNTAANSCFVQYDRSNNGVLLLNDAGTGWEGGVLGGNGTLQNSQCAITLANSSLALVGNTLTLSLAMTFKAGFAGAKDVYLYAAAGTAVSGWQDRGDWIVP